MRQFISALVLLLVGNLAMAESADPTVRAEAMLERLGGREPWAALRNTINGSQQNRVQEPTVVYAVITMDFEQPRFRIETSARGLHLIRVIDGNNSWRLRGSGKIEDVPAELFAEDMTWYQAHLYRTIHRVASRDPTLSLRNGEDSRLEVHSADKRLLWFKLDARSEPYAFGVYDNDAGSFSGPWDVVKDGIHHPRWISSSDGSWRAAVQALQINVPLHDSMFARPADQ